MDIVLFTIIVIAVVITLYSCAVVVVSLYHLLLSFFHSAASDINPAKTEKAEVSVRVAARLRPDQEMV
jgi:hypothetical protein